MLALACERYAEFQSSLRPHKVSYFCRTNKLRETMSCQRIAHGSRSPESKNKRRLEIYRMIYTEYFLIPISRFYQPVESQAIFILVDAVDEPRVRSSYVGLIDRTLEDGLLHALTEVLAHLRDSAQSPFALGCLGGHIVSNENQHRVT